MTLIDDNRLLVINKLMSHGQKHLSTGGSAGNVVRALACLGAETGFIGKVGKDDYGDFYRKSLRTRGIEAQILVSDKRLSGISSIFISPEGERTFATCLGAAASLHPEDLRAEFFRGFDATFIEGYMVQDYALISRAVKLAKDAGLTTCLDLGSYNIVAKNLEFFTTLVKEDIDIVFANEEEAKAFTGKKPEEALDDLARQCDIAVVKMGARGSLACRREEKVHVPAGQAGRVADTTGAGDFYAAGFLYGLTCGCTLESCARIGSLLAGSIVQVVGTGLPDEAWQRLKAKVDAIACR